MQSCSLFSHKTEDNDIVFKVGDKALTRDDINTILERGHIPADTMQYLHHYLRNWAIQQLLLQNAEDNIRNAEQIDSLVSDFRKSLLISMYEENLLKERLSGEITQEQLRSYYDKNPSFFVLGQNLIRGVFLKVPVDAPNVNKLKDWMKKLSSDDIEKIEKYSILNAQIYDYFLDKWVDLSDLLRAMPLTGKSSQETLLKEDKLIEGTDDRFLYLLRVKEYKLKGEQEPFEVARPRIEEILLNERKNQFISDFRNEMYEWALESGKIVYHLK
ncbi:MAG: hypothetical protein PUB21_03370 [Bacteroidales bacterium]|nr:hypothetical protein [Bacteroidales bacterium]